MGVKIFAGRASEKLAKQIAKSYGQELGNVNVNVFSDGEFQPSLEETVRGQDVFIVQSTMPPTENIFELLLLIDAARRASARKIIEVVYSPPADIPCRRRKSTTAMGAAIPIWAWVGKKAIATVGIAMAITDRLRARRRPTKSPMRPYTIPPSGRTMNPAANAPKAPISDAVGLVEGKNCWPITVAK